MNKEGRAEGGMKSRGMTDNGVLLVGAPKTSQWQCEGRVPTSLATTQSLASTRTASLNAD